MSELGTGEPVPDQGHVGHLLAGLFLTEPLPPDVDPLLVLVVGPQPFDAAGRALDQLGAMLPLPHRLTALSPIGDLRPRNP